MEILEKFPQHIPAIHLGRYMHAITKIVRAIESEISKPVGCFTTTTKIMQMVTHKFHTFQDN